MQCSMYAMSERTPLTKTARRGSEAPLLLMLEQAGNFVLIAVI